MALNENPFNEQNFKEGDDGKNYSTDNHAVTRR